MKPILIFYCIFFPLFISVQSSYEEDLVIVQGKVVDENGEGVPGVTILAKGDAVHTTTDINGYFTGRLGKNMEILFSQLNGSTFFVKVADLESTNYQVELDISTMTNLINDQVVGYIPPKAPFRKRLWWKIKRVFTRKY